MANVVVCDLAISPFRVMDRLVLVHRVGVAGDDIPGVDQAGNVPETAEADVDERIGGAEADFDPYC